jgi:hypothetical protein
MGKRRKRPNFISRRSLTLLFVSFLHPVPIHASSKRESHWSFLSDDIGTLYMSEDESEERILAALADISLDDESENERSSYSSSSTQLESPEKHHLSSQQRMQRPKTKMSEKTTATKQQNQLSYVTLPETYRAVPTARITRPETQASLPPAVTIDAPEKTRSRIVTTAPTTSISPWIQRFLAYCHRDALLPLPLDFLMDNFNLAQLAPVVERIALAGYSDEERQQIMRTLDNTQPYPIYRRAIQLLVQQQQLEGDDDDMMLQHLPPFVEAAARALYLLLHQRFCLSPRGLDMVRRRFLAMRDPNIVAGKAPKRLTVFGECPNPSCRKASLLPCGASDNYQSLAGWNATTNAPMSRLEHRCQRYCCQCHQIFVFRGSKVDGCAWGTSFCNLFVLTYGKSFLTSRTSLQQVQVNQRMDAAVAKHSLSNGKVIEPTIFGFRVRPDADWPRQGQ